MTSQNIKRRILVVDDQPDITITLKIGLEEDGGFDVDAFTDPEHISIHLFELSLGHMQY